MKKVMFLLACLVGFGISAANAQCHGSASTSSTSDAPKACCASKMSSAANKDATIEKRMDDDGTVSYVRKEQDATGNVRFVSVRFDESTNTFVNVAPGTMTADAKSGMTKKTATCSEAEKKACCSKDGSSAKKGKSCCASKEGTNP